MPVETPKPVRQGPKARKEKQPEIHVSMLARHDKQYPQLSPLVNKSITLALSAETRDIQQFIPSHFPVSAPAFMKALLTRKSFAGRKRFFFAKSSRCSRLRGESWAGLSPRRREENAKDFSLVAALPLCVHLWFDFVRFTQTKAPSSRRRILQIFTLLVVRSSRNFTDRSVPCPSAEFVSRRSNVV